MNTVQKIAAGFTFFLALLFLFPTPAFAAISSAQFRAPQNADYLLNMNVLQAGDCAVGVPVDKITNDQSDQCLVKDPVTGELSLADQVPGGGLTGGLGNTIVALYSTPPISTGEYFAYEGQKLGIISPAYAQSVTGAGSGVLNPVINVWGYVRNIAYLAFIVVFMVVGFMIMFRQKINPQTVISVQAALPGLVIGLVLVTFSYFISAFLVDLSFVGMHLVAGIFNSIGTTNVAGNAGDINKIATTGNIWDLFKTFIFNGNNFSQLAGPIKDAFVAVVPGAQSTPSPLDVVRGNTGSAVVWLLSRALGGILGLLGILIIMIALIIAMFKLLWELINAYITILITTILSPLIILWSSFPGKSGTLGEWWKTILGNVLIFPVVFAAFLFAGLFLGSTDPNMFKTTLPLFNGIPVSLFRTLLGYGILLATPGIPKFVKEAIGVKDNPLGAVAAAGFSGGVGLVTGGASKGYGAGTAELRTQKEAFQRAQMNARAEGNAHALERSQFVLNNDPLMKLYASPGRFARSLFRRNGPIPEMPTPPQPPNPTGTATG